MHKKQPNMLKVNLGYRDMINAKTLLNLMLM